MQLNKQDLKYKEYIKLRNRLDKVYLELRKLVNVELKKPYQSGWIIYYDLRDDIKRRKDYPMIKQILELGYPKAYTRNVKVIKAIRSKESTIKIKSRWGLHAISNYYPKSNYITKENYDILQKQALNIDKYFSLDSEYKTRSNRYRYYCTLPQYWLVLKVKPNMITHRYLKGGALEEEEAYLKDRLWYSGEFISFHVNYGSSYPAYKDRSKVRDKISKYMKGEIDDIENEKVPKEYDY